MRTLGEPFILFMIPFGLYIGFLVAQLVNPFSLNRWTRRVLIPLALAGVTLVLLSLVLTGIFADRHAGGYQPAHIENGRIVPGLMK